MRDWAMVLLLALGCGRIGFDPADPLPPSARAGIPTGVVELAPNPDGAGFSLVWSAVPADRVVPAWFFGVVDNTGAWTTAPVELFEDRGLPLQSVQLACSGDGWILARRYDWSGTRAPLDLAVLDDTGGVEASFEDDQEWLAAATVAPHANGFLVVYHHHTDQSDGMRRRQVYVRDYDALGNVTRGEAQVEEALDMQLLVVAGPLAEGVLVVWREELAGARFAVLDATGAKRSSGAIAEVTDMFWKPEIHVAAGLPLFVRGSEAGLRVQRMESDGRASWVPAEIDLALGLNRFESRTWAAASDDEATYVAWESDVTTELPQIAVAKLTASASTPVLEPLAPVTDGTAPALEPAVAVSPTHYAVAYVEEGAGRRTLLVEVRAR